MVEYPDNFAEKIAKLKGPILVLGASGFIGSNMLRILLSHRNDVYGTTTSMPNWRLEDVDKNHIIEGDLSKEGFIERIIQKYEPKTVFDFVAYGAYSFQQNERLIYDTNFILKTRLLDILAGKNIDYFHSGSSSEYGDVCAGPDEDQNLKANSHYSVSKSAISNLIYFYGKKKGLRCANLRLYSVYGYFEDSSRLIPMLVKKGLGGTLPEFVSPQISRDFVFCDDACEAFFDAAINLTPELYGDSFNIGSGKKTTIGDIAIMAKNIFAIKEEPAFKAAARDWDVENWYADPTKAKKLLGWKAQTELKDGLIKTSEWIKANLEIYNSNISTKKDDSGIDHEHSISAIIACYKDAQAIPEMHERLSAVFRKLKVDYEIIFVNDCSPDDSEEIIRRISEGDKRVTGITHSRNFGSQAAFRSGLEVATKNSCVLLDGDLQDPPELIEEFLAQWKNGHEVVYGRRISREAPLHMKFLYKLFYRIFARFSYITIPHDAGDFALMEKKVVECMLQFPERDLFLRGVRAYAGFRQVGVDYVRPERKYGRTTNSLFKNIGWAKKGIFSFSYVPLNVLSAAGWVLLFVSILLAAFQVVVKLLYPDSAPPGVTTILLVVAFFGSFNLFAISILGEYLAKIFEEVKARPHFIRRGLIKRGSITQFDNSAKGQ